MRDAANPWMFIDRGEAWDGVRIVAFNASPEPSHAVDITDTFDAGLRSLECHRVYLENLNGESGDPARFLREAATASGKRFGVELATTFEVVG